MSKLSHQEKRDALKSLSSAAKMAIAMGATDASHVNEWVLDHYREENPEISEFNTFNQWKEKGCSVKKGSKAFVIWGSPRKGKKQEESPKDDSTEDEYKFFPLSYLFADTQVEIREVANAE